MSEGGHVTKRVYISPGSAEENFWKIYCQLTQYRSETFVQDGKWILEVRAYPPRIERCGEGIVLVAAEGERL